VFAEFEADLLKMRTREGIAIARSRGKLKGKQPKLTTRQQAEPVRMAQHRRLPHRRSHGGFLMSMEYVGRVPARRSTGSSTTSTA